MDLRRQRILFLGSAILLVGVVLFVVGLVSDNHTLRGIAGFVSAVGSVISLVILNRILLTAPLSGRDDLSEKHPE